MYIITKQFITNLFRHENINEEVSARNLPCTFNGGFSQSEHGYDDSPKRHREGCHR